MSLFQILNIDAFLVLSLQFCYHFLEAFLLKEGRKVQNAYVAQSIKEPCRVKFLESWGCRIRVHLENLRFCEGEIKAERRKYPVTGCASEMDLHIALAV